MRPERHLRWLIVIVALLVAAGPAAADEPSARDKKKARQLVESANSARAKGDKLSKKGKDGQARTQWRKSALAYLEAYSLIDDPFLLFRLSEVYRARGEKLWALAGFYTYVDKEPSGTGVERAKQAIDELEKELASERKAGATTESSGDRELDPSAVFDPLPKLQSEEPRPEPKPKKKPPVRKPIVDEGPREQPAGHPGRTLRWSGYAAAGVGVILLGVGTAYGFQAASAASDLSNKEGAWNLNDRRRIDEGERAERNQIIFTLVGTAAVGAGATLWWLGHRAEGRARAERRTEVTLIPSSGGARLVVGGAF